MAAKFFTGLPMDGPDPECVQGYGAPALVEDRVKPRPSGDHSRLPVALTLSKRPATPVRDVVGPATPVRDVVGPATPVLDVVATATPPTRPCNESPV